MLHQLHIEAFTIVDRLTVEFNTGMTVFTGETGAGKSILLDALGLALGDRGDSKLIRHGQSQLDISARFHLANTTLAQQWLLEHELADESGECVVRRTLNDKGRSLAYINGKPATLQQLKELGTLLVHIHGQHEHHALLKSTVQRQRLDAFAKAEALVTQTSEAFQTWKEQQHLLTTLTQQQADQHAKQALLRYQLAEIEQLELYPCELEQLHQQQHKLHHMQHLIDTCSQACEQLQDADVAILPQLGQLQQSIQKMNRVDTSLSPLEPMLKEALVNLQEIYQELQRYQSRLEPNPEALQNTEQRLAKIYDMARKHRIEPTLLEQHQQQLQEQLLQYQGLDQQITELTLASEQAQQQYLTLAEKLHQHREKAAKKLTPKVIAFMEQLGMQGGQFNIQLEVCEPSAQGIDQIHFLVSTNPGQPLQTMRDIVSGGELSRLSLALQVLTAEQHPTPTLIFDEVDVGIGGGTAEVVGQLLHQLGEHCQVLCVTHLPQVAALGDHHIHAQKLKKTDSTTASVTILSHEQRVQEIARMLGGVKITPQTLAHAQEMIKSSCPKT
jgi:DNA repair protein RecN (Recombination protein N)